MKTEAPFVSNTDASQSESTAMNIVLIVQSRLHFVLL